MTLRFVRAEGGPESTVVLEKDVWTCGRQGDFPLPDDPFVAPQQMRFSFSGNKLVVDDCGGGNGVFSRLRHERELGVGNELRIGRQRLVVEALPPLAATHGVVTWGSVDPGYRFRMLQVLEGGLRGSAYPLAEGDTLVGRENGDITFPHDGFVSGRHAVFSVRSGRLWVKDLGSSNGTFVRLGAPSYAESGDQFLVGRQLVRVEIQPRS